MIRRVLIQYIYFLIILFHKRTREDYDFSQLKMQRHIGLISLADLYNQIRGDHSIGTFGSNWCRLIYELKMTVGMKSDGFIFEVGNERCISFYDCVSRNTFFNGY